MSFRIRQSSESWSTIVENFLDELTRIHRPSENVTVTYAWPFYTRVSPENFEEKVILASLSAVSPDLLSLASPLLRNVIRDINTSVVVRLSVPALYYSRIISYSILLSYRDLKRSNIPVFFEQPLVSNMFLYAALVRDVEIKDREEGKKHYDLALCSAVMLLPVHMLLGVEEDPMLPEGFAITGLLRHTQQGISIRVRPALCTSSEMLTRITDIISYYVQRLREQIRNCSDVIRGVNDLIQRLDRVRRQLQHLTQSPSLQVVSSIQRELVETLTRIMNLPGEMCINKFEVISIAHELQRCNVLIPEIAILTNQQSPSLRRILQRVSLNLACDIAHVQYLLNELINMLRRYRESIQDCRLETCLDQEIAERDYLNQVSQIIQRLEDFVRRARNIVL